MIKATNFSLDVVRAVSAFLVVISHVRAALFVNFTDLDYSGPFSKMFFLLTGFGHEAVLIFFVLSGYLVGGSVLRSQSDFSWVRYLAARLLRLWIVLVPTLIVGAALAFWIDQNNSAILKGVFFRYWSSGPENSKAFSMSVQTLIGNLFFLQTIVVPVYAGNGPLWSLANEFWYYIIFPLLVLGGRDIFCKTSVGRGVLQISLGAAVVLILPLQIIFGFIIWIMGAAAAWAKQGRSFKGGYLQAIIFIIFVACVVSSRVFRNYAVLLDLLIGITFSGFLVMVKNSNMVKAVDDRWWRKCIEYFSSSSYSLYLIHFPLLLLLVSFKSELISRYYLSAQSLLIFGIYVFGLYVCAHFFWYVFERNTDFMRGQLVKVLRKSSPT